MSDAAIEALYLEERSFEPPETFRKQALVTDRSLHEEADNLIAKAGDHLKPVLVTALETGGRLSEVLGLRWTDVDFELACIFLV